MSKRSFFTFRRVRDVEVEVVPPEESPPVPPPPAAPAPVEPAAETPPVAPPPAEPTPLVQPTPPPPPPSAAPAPVEPAAETPPVAPPRAEPTPLVQPPPPPPPPAVREEPSPQTSATAAPRELVCEITLWRGYRKSMRFYARMEDEDGEEVAVAESATFRGAQPDEELQQNEEAVAAYKALRAELEQGGWQHRARGVTWYGDTFRRDVAE